MKHFLSLCLLINAFTLNGQQIGTVEIKEETLTPWLPKITLEYEGLYHFGEGDLASQLRLFFADTLPIVQIREGYWEENTGVWKWRYTNLAPVRIGERGNFTAAQYTGQFVRYTDSTGTYKGLKIDNPWSARVDSRYEIGIRKNADPRSFPGQYPQASTRFLTSDDLKNLHKTELNLMRHEVLARYGFAFPEEPLTKEYFGAFSWYAPQHDDVSSFLTIPERHNIELITETISAR